MMRSFLLFFFFMDTSTTEIYTLSLHDALPICIKRALRSALYHGHLFQLDSVRHGRRFSPGVEKDTAEPGTSLRSEEHTSELQSRFDLVCRLLLEKKKNIIKII